LDWSKLKRVILQLGGRPDKANVDRECYRDASSPKGKVWVCNGIHSLISRCYKCQPESYAEALQDLYDRVILGAQDCYDPNCGCLYWEE